MELKETNDTREFLTKFPINSASRVVDKLFYGDQTKKADFAQVIQRARDIGLYDIVIDDGGHTSGCIISTIENLLLTVVKPGGLLVIEDMHTFTSESYTSDSPKSHLSFFQELLEDQLRLAVKAGGGVLNHPELSPAISSVDCMSELCVITRRAEDPGDDWLNIYRDCMGTLKCDCGYLGEQTGDCV